MSDKLTLDTEENKRLLELYKKIYTMLKLFPVFEENTELLYLCY